VDSLAVVEKEVVVSSCGAGNPRLDDERGRILDVPTGSRPPSCAMRCVLLCYVRASEVSSRTDCKGMRW